MDPGILEDLIRHYWPPVSRHRCYVKNEVNLRDMLPICGGVFPLSREGGWEHAETNVWKSSTYSRRMLTQSWHVDKMKHSIKKLYLKTGVAGGQKRLPEINFSKAFMNSCNNHGCVFVSIMEDLKWPYIQYSVKNTQSSFQSPKI